MENVNIFEQATKAKLRFKAANGLIGVEDLWDLSLTDLDDMAKALRKEVRETDDSFIEDKKADPKIEMRFEIVKRVIDVKLEEKRAKADKRANDARRQQLQEALAEKKAEGLKNKTVEELEAELANLG